MIFRQELSKMWSNIQHHLFPYLEQKTGPLSKKHKELVSILELVRVEEFIPSNRWYLGRPSEDKSAIAKAFIAKSVFMISHTKELIRQLKVDMQLRVICGWDYYSKIPSESTFSRVFREFAETNLPDRVHQALIKEIHKDKIVGHLTKDSTAINGREKGLRKEKSHKERKKILNKKYAKEKKEGTGRKQKQLTQTLEEMMSCLPTVCDFGRKKSGQGIDITWKGYKLHMAVEDNCIPIAFILTSASLNDSEAAIPLAEKSKRLVQNFYDLMDAAYDVEEVKKHSISQGRVPIIDRCPRSKLQKEEKQAEKDRKRVLNFKTAEDRRYENRFSKERSNALMKEYYGGKNINYKGHAKVFCHLSFGILSLTAIMLLKFLN